MEPASGRDSNAKQPVKIDDLPVPVALIDLNGNLLGCNDAFRKFTGYTDGKPVPPEIATALLPADPENTASHLVRLPVKDGAPIEAEVFLRKITDPHLTYYSACVIDISGRMGRTATPESDNRLSRVVMAIDNIGEILIITDDKSYIVYANHVAERIFKTGPGELAGKSLWEGCSGLASGNLKTNYLLTLQKGTPRITREYFVRRNAWYDIYFYPYDRGVAILMVNVTRSVQFELWSEMSTFALNRMSDYVLWVNRNGHLYYVNSITRNLRKDLADRKGQATIFEISPGITPEVWQRIMDECRLSGTPRFETKLVDDEGRSIPVDVSANYIKFRDREYVCLIARDMTDRKHAEAEVREAREQAELYLDLMSHDINNINQVGMGFLELVLDSPAASEEQKDLLSRPMEAFRNSSRLIANVKNLQKAHEGRIKLGPVVISEILAGVRNEFSRISGREIIINYDPSHNCTISANELVREVFTNLVGNAVKHSTGPLTIDIKVETVTIDGRPYCEVAVEDNGPGIPDEVKTSIFSQRYAGERSMRRRGIGLFIVKTLVDDFHGSIRVEDRVPGDSSKGTRFVVTLPSG